MCGRWRLHRALDWDVDIIDTYGQPIYSQTEITNGVMQDGDSGSSVTYNNTMFGIYSSDEGFYGYFTTVNNFQINTGYDLCTIYNYAC